ncbi:MAG: hemolysin III family protein [Mesorhizobium sp.]
MSSSNWPPSREFSTAERIADVVVHGVGLAIALVAGTVLLVLAANRLELGEFSSLVLYVLLLVTVMSVSGLYNALPVSPIKTFLRRFDHAAIYLLIAASYTPFAVQILDHAFAPAVLALVWVGAIAGMAVKLFLPGRFDRTAIALYLLLGWSGVALFTPLFATLPATSVWLIVAGGIAYSTGVIFFVLHRMRFQTAIWHGFVVTGAALHLAAVTDFVIARA